MDIQNNDDNDNDNCNNNDNSNISFIEIYEQVVAEALLIFGRHIQVLVSLYIREKYSINRLGYTAANPKILSEALKMILNGGSKIAQRRILRLLYNKIGIEQSFDTTINFEEKILKAIKEFDNKHHYYYNA